MIAEQEGQCPARADSQTRGSGEIVFRDHRVLHFIVVANIDRRDPVDGGFDLLAIAIVGEVGRRVA
jgi:hypothetical protein